MVNGKYANPIGSVMGLYMPPKKHPQEGIRGRIYKALFCRNHGTVNTCFPEKEWFKCWRGWCPLIPIVVRPYYHRIHV